MQIQIIADSGHDGDPSVSVGGDHGDDRVLTGPHGHKTTRKHSAIWAYGFTMFQEAKLLASQIMDLFWQKYGKQHFTDTYYSMRFGTSTGS